MKHAIILILLTAFCCLAQDMVQIENFSEKVSRKWSYDKKAKLEFHWDREAGEMQFKVPPDKVSWFYCNLEEPVDLAVYPILEVEMRGTNPGIHRYDIFIRKTDDGKEPQSFYSSVELNGNQWKKVRMDTRLQGRSHREALQGKFRAFGRQIDHTLRPGGKMNRLTFTTIAKADDFAIRNISFLKENAPQTVRRNIELLPERPVYRPYEFRSADHARLFTITEDGKSDYSIFIPANASPTVVFAAGELQKYLAQSTSARLPVKKGAATGNGIHLSVEAINQPLEAFQLSGRQGRISITGQSERGLLYGVYDFLEKSCGIRFFAPFETYQIIPEIKKLELPEFSDGSEPLMDYRRFHYCSHRNTSLKRRYEVADWSVKNRYNVQLGLLIKPAEKNSLEIQEKNLEKFYAERGGRSAMSNLWGHNYQRLISPRKYFAEHPEFFCWNRVEKKWQWERAQICCTNPEVIKILADTAAEYFADYPDRDLFPVMAEDGTRLWCQCDNCSKLDAPGVGYSHDFMSDRALYLANHVKQELNRRGLSDKKVVTSVYQPTQRLPSHVKPIEGILLIYCFYTDGDINFVKPAIELDIAYELDQWSKLNSGNIILYNYLYCGFFYQFSLDKQMSADYRFYQRMGIKGNTQETFESWGFDDYMMYLGARLAWDSWFDIAAFKDDYFSKLYGNASDPMRKFHDTCQRIFEDTGRYRTVGARQYPDFTPDDIRSLAELLDTAETAAAGNDRVLGVIARKRLLHRYIVIVMDTLGKAAAFYDRPTAESYRIATDGVKNLRRTVDELYRNGEIVAQRMVSHMDNLQRGLDRVWLQITEKESLEGKYRIIASLPANGWRFQADPYLKGDAETWAVKADYGKWAQIRIGETWERQGHAGYDGVAWYQLNYTIPKELKESNLLSLYFQGVDETAHVFVNGKLMGERAGDPEKIWDKPFRIDLSGTFMPGEQINIVVKVHDSGGMGGIYKPVMLIVVR